MKKLTSDYKKEIKQLKKAYITVAIEAGEIAANEASRLIHAKCLVESYKGFYWQHSEHPRKNWNKNNELSRS
jgi:hypothetical protein